LVGLAELISGSTTAIASRSLQPLISSGKEKENLAQSFDFIKMNFNVDSLWNWHHSDNFFHLWQIRASSICINEKFSKT
jgi:hypothetical protein